MMGLPEQSLSNCSMSCRYESAFLARSIWGTVVPFGWITFTTAPRDTFSKRAIWRLLTPLVCSSRIAIRCSRFSMCVLLFHEFPESHQVRDRVVDAAHGLLFFRFIHKTPPLRASGAVRREAWPWATTRQRSHDVEIVQQGFGWIRGHGFLRHLPPGLQEKQRLVHDAAAQRWQSIPPRRVELAHLPCG